MKALLGDRVMILPISEEEVLEDSGFVLDEDKAHLPKAEVVMVSDELRNKEDLVNVPEVGDKVLFSMPREQGIYKHEGKQHHIVSIGALVAIL
jgi:co-chaperonin GroES (HSP10)